jgi:hypothetical protein
MSLVFKDARFLNTHTWSGMVGRGIRCKHPFWWADALRTLYPNPLEVQYVGHQDAPEPDMV